MMKNLFAVYGFLLVAWLPAQGEADHPEVIETLHGRRYEDCRIRQIQPDGISFVHAGGAAKVLFADLSEPLKKRFGFCETRLAEYERERATRLAAEQKRLRDARQIATEQAQRLMEIQLKIWQAAEQRQEQQIRAAMESRARTDGTDSWSVADYGPLAPIHGPAFGGREWIQVRQRWWPQMMVDCGFATGFGPIWPVAQPCWAPSPCAPFPVRPLSGGFFQLSTGSVSGFLRWP
jgi:hypothetical protein